MKWPGGWTRARRKGPCWPILRKLQQERPITGAVAKHFLPLAPGGQMLIVPSLGDARQEFRPPTLRLRQALLFKISNRIPCPHRRVSVGRLREREILPIPPRNRD